MPLNEHLIPISFHLRHFNKYTKLDIDASQMGNVTLIGENAVGKTTLANCFFPMLIDGSIATPSFNAAKGTDRLDKTARNSSQDARNFDSMLLGWGADAMKVRTGYSYLRLRSKQRQVILGIGATRTSGSPSKPTWWFMANNNDPTGQLDLVTTDNDGRSLDKTAFKAENATLGIPLQVFDNATAYRDQVATQIYGFDGGGALNKLAAAYRLLASPILTAGNAKFTPIIEALKNAQEGIDPQTINRIADSQREVNYTNGLLERLGRVEKRLHKIRKDVFWSNLNRLNELTLISYTDSQQRLGQQQLKLDTARGIIEDCERQLITVRASVQQTVEKLQMLREQQAAQAVIENQRKQLQTEIANLNQQLATYQAQLNQLATINQQLTVVEQDLADNKQQQVAVKTQQLSPLRAKLDQHSAALSELRQVMTEIELAKLAEGLRKYVQLQKLTQTKYAGLTSQIEQGSHDVKIVGQMKTRLDDAIDERVQGTLSGGRIREGLHEDNQTIHDHGASEMDERVKGLMEQRDQLMIAHPDLKVILAEPTLLSNLSKLQKELAKTLQQLTELQRTAKQLSEKQADTKNQIKQVQDTMDSNFDVERVQQRIATCQQQHDGLVLDPNIKDKVTQAIREQTRYEQTARELENKKTQNQERLEQAKVAIEDYQERIDQLSKQTMANLQVLRPYFPEHEEFVDVDDIVAFVSQNRRVMESNPFDELVDKVGRAIHSNGADGTDDSAIDTVFEERSHGSEASQMRQQRTLRDHDLIVVPFDINHALALIVTDQQHVQQKLAQLEQGNDVAQTAYLAAAIERIDKQYKLIDQYNQMLSQGIHRAQSIKLKIILTPSAVTDNVIAEARDAFKEDRPCLLGEVRKRLNYLANDTKVAGDEDAFNAEAQKLLDTRQWSEFQVLIKRRQSNDDEYEIVDDKFVQSGGSGAEKAQAMVLPLLLVPKMVLQQSNLTDAPYLVMFDEFADKLDPETAKSFARTIANFGFNFIATMPSGAQNKILADGVANVAYEVIAPQAQGDGKFRSNTVRAALIWQKEAYDGSLS